jgi:hypothetical protein
LDLLAIPTPVPTPIIKVTVDSGTNWSAWAAVFLSGVLAVITFFYAMDTRRMARIVQAQYDVDRASTRRSQAQQVSAWASDAGARTRLTKDIILEMVNHSGEPIYDMSMTVCDVNGDTVPGVAIARPVVAPGEHIRSEPTPIDVRARPFPRTGAMVELEFFDARRVAWHRGPTGELREGSSPT